jgi:hypothetical protein
MTPDPHGLGSTLDHAATRSQLRREIAAKIRFDPSLGVIGTVSA